MTQKSQVREFCLAQPADFSLSEVYFGLAHLPKATVRALLQRVRDEGVIEFVDYNGTYRVR